MTLPKSSKRQKQSRPKATERKHTTLKTKPTLALKPVVPAPVTGITTYSSAIRWLHEHTDHERMRLVKYNPSTFNLDRMRKLLKVLGNPQKDLKFVHVAGTKGKGSTCAMLASMLRSCGYTIGCYTSPHLIDIRERI